MPKQPLPLEQPKWAGAFHRLRHHHHWTQASVSIHIGTGVVWVSVCVPYHCLAGANSATSAEAELPPGEWHRVPEAIDALAQRILDSGHAPECNVGPKGEIPDHTYGLPIPEKPVVTQNGARVGFLFD